jgi:hypothetical protein
MTKRLMNSLTFSRIALFVLLVAAFAAAKDKTPPTYRHGTITGWDTRVDTHSAGNGQTIRRRIKVYKLKGSDLIYDVDECGAFQAGEFTAGQTVDYRVDEAGKRIYIRHDNDKEYKCKMDGASSVGSDSDDAPSATH